MAFASLKTHETDLVRAEMLRRGVTMEEMAVRCGLLRKSLSNQISKNFPSRRVRLTVETVLGLAIWSSVRDFQRRAGLQSRCGFDPFIIGRSELRRRVAGLGIRGRSKGTQRAALISLLEEYLDENN